MKTLLVIMTFFVATPLMACMMDSDCAIGSHCARRDSSMNGVCRRSKPGYDYQQMPTFNNVISPNTKQDKTCLYDSQCGMGSRCIKGGYSYQGFCE